MFYHEHGINRTQNFLISRLTSYYRICKTILNRKINVTLNYAYCALYFMVYVFTYLFLISIIFRAVHAIAAYTVSYGAIGKHLDNCAILLSEVKFNYQRQLLPNMQSCLV